MQNKKLLTVKEFASEYNIGTNKAYEMAHSKNFPMIRLGKKILIIKNLKKKRNKQINKLKINKNRKIIITN